MKKLISTILLLTSSVAIDAFAISANNELKSESLDRLESRLVVQNISVRHIPGAKTAALYCSFHGVGVEDITILHLKPSIGKAFIHKHSTDPKTGVHQMQNIDKIVIPQGVVWNLADHHQHIMFTNLDAQMHESIDLVIYYTVGQDVVEKSLTVKVDLKHDK